MTRSSVPAGLPYKDYKKYLRPDFFYACAYCTMTEAEAQGIRFTIDHYESQSTNPALVDDYSNLMWCCDKCNLLKSDLTPPPAARSDGKRFYRPDVDAFEEHFRVAGRLLHDLSQIGWFTKEFLDLNRLSLQRIRDIRRRLYECDQAVAAGLQALRDFRIDQLPKELRHKVNRAIEQMAKEHVTVIEMIEHVLKENSKSPLLDDDDEAPARAKQRAEKLKEIGALYPGDWRSSNRKRAARS